MRVAHVHRMRGIGGSERHLLTLLPALAELGDEPIFVGLDDPAWSPAPFYRALDRAGIRFVRLRSPHDLDPRLIFELARTFRAVRPDLVHTHLVHADVYGALATPTPLVSTKHNDDPFRTGPFRHVERVLAARARRLIAITHALRRFTVEQVGIPAEKVDVVHYGLDAPPEPWGENPPLALPEDARVLVAICRLVPQKGVDLAIRALAQVRGDHPDAALVVLGEGPERPALERLARELGVADAVFLPGRHPDAAAWLRRAELLVHPARWEGFGLAVLEAMLSKLPVVAMPVSSIPELVVGGRTGFLVGEDGFAHAIGELLEHRDLARKMGQAGLRRAREEFSVERMARRTREVYEAAAA